MVRYTVCLLALLTGCATVTHSLDESVDSAVDIAAPSLPKYAVGDCLMIVDLPNGKVESPYRVRVEKIEAGAYWYRWLLDNGRWAVDLSCLRKGNGPCWEFKSLEKISKKVEDCPRDA